MACTFAIRAITGGEAVMQKYGIFIISFFLSCPAMIWPGVIHVPGDQPTIQAGIDAAVDGDTVLVADGTYTGAGNKNLDFYGKAITVKAENGPDHCVIDCEGSETDPHRGFYFHSGEDENSVVQGFTIRNGFIVEPDDGAGIYCEYASPVITGNIITGNTALDNGGGIYCHSGAPAITCNTITGNTAGNSAGGIYCISDCHAVIANNTIALNTATSAGGVICRESSIVIRNNIIQGNSASSENGGGIILLDYGYASSPTISGNRIIENTAGLRGGGISCALQISATILDNHISGNRASWGGGISCGRSSADIINNTIAGNFATGNGGGIHLHTHASPGIINNIIIENSAGNRGGGMSCNDKSLPAITNNTIADNTAEVHGGGISFHKHSSPLIKNCILWNNAPEEIYRTYESRPVVAYSDVQGGYDGTGNINIDPRFVSGHLGDYYLSQVAAGQSDNSPCLNAGDPASQMIEGTTRTDAVQDAGIVDMGYHYPFPVQGLVVGPGPAYGNPPLVRIFSPGQEDTYEYEFSAYGSPHYGVNVTCGDVYGDGYDRIITGAGPGDVFGPHVRGFEVDGTPLPGFNFMAYGTQKFGVNVATGDIDQDGYDEIITGAGPGAVFGPHVRAFDYDGTPSIAPVPGVSFMAYNTRQWGVNVTGGDIDGDGFDEIVTGPGPGVIFGPHVRAWDVDGETAEAISEVSFFAYGMREYGVVVACGDADGDGFDEIVTAPGPCVDFLANIRGWNYDDSAISPLPGCRFFAWHSSQARYGAKVFVGADMDENGSDEQVIGAGPDPDTGTPVKVYRYDGSGVTEWYSLQAFPSSYTRGVNVAAGRF